MSGVGLGAVVELKAGVRFCTYVGVMGGTRHGAADELMDDARLGAAVELIAGVRFCTYVGVMGGTRHGAAVELMDDARLGAAIVLMIDRHGEIN